MVDDVDTLDEVAPRRRRTKAAAEDMGAADMGAALDDAEAADTVEAVHRYNPLRDLEGTSGALHAVHQRLAELLPFLPEAIEQSDGERRACLEMMLKVLKS